MKKWVWVESMNNWRFAEVNNIYFIESWVKIGKDWKIKLRRACNYKTGTRHFDTRGNF